MGEHIYDQINLSLANQSIHRNELQHPRDILLAYIFDSLGLTTVSTAQLIMCLEHNAQQYSSDLNRHEKTRNQLHRQYSDYDREIFPFRQAVAYELMRRDNNA